MKINETVYPSNLVYIPILFVKKICVNILFFFSFGSYNSYSYVHFIKLKCKNTMRFINIKLNLFEIDQNTRKHILNFKNYIR